MNAYLELFLVFLKIGAFTFGGGYAMLPFIQEEVAKRNWMAIGTFWDFVAVSESTPGPFAINIATYVGTEKAGMLGALCATLGVAAPSFIIIIVISKFYLKFKRNKYVQGAMSGLRPAAIGLIASAVILAAKNIFLSSNDGSPDNFPLYFYIALFAVTLFYISLKKINPLFIVLICAATGIIYGYVFAL